MTRVKVGTLTTEEDVDDSSGVESAPGLKGHSSVRAFVRETNAAEGRGVLQ